MGLVQDNILGTEKIGKLILKFSIPAIIGQIVNMLYSIIDRMYIGNIPNVGGLAITGVGISMPITQIITGLGMLIGVGASASISLSLGRGEKDKAEKFFGNALISIVVISLFVAIFGNMFINPIMRLFGATDNTLPYGIAYLSPILFGTIFNLTAFGLNGCISSDGSPKVGMFTMIIGAIINIILDPILIFGFNMGIAGAAYATVFSQFIAACWVIFYFTKSKHSNIKLKIKNMKIDKKILFAMLSIGSAPFFMNLAGSIVNIVSNKALVTYGGDLAIGAMAVITSICTIFIMPLFGLTHGAQPIIGFNYGAKKYDRVKKTYFTVLAVATTILTVSFLGIFFFPEMAVSMFNKDPELTSIAVSGMRVYLLALPFIGIQLCSSSYYQSTGKPAKAMIIGLTRQVLFLIPLFLILPRFFGLNGIWYAGPIADMASVILSAIIIFNDIRKLGKDTTNLDIEKIA